MKRRFFALALVFTLIFSVMPVQASTAAEISAQMDALRTQITALENELERDYANVVSVNGEIISRNPLTVKVNSLVRYDYYVVQNPVADSTYMFGMYYNNYHKVTGSTVIYENGVARNATVVGKGYPRAKEIKSQLNDLKIQLSNLDDQLYGAQLIEKYMPVQAGNEQLKSLQSVRQDGVRLICKVGNPYLLVCGEETKPSAGGSGRYFMRGQEVYPMEANGGDQDYGVQIGENQNLSDTPVVINGSVMIAPRSLVEWLGGSLDWDASTGVITCSLNGNSVVVVIGSDIAYVNGVAETMPAAVTIYNNSTVVPLRFVAEKLGCRVEWIPGGQYVQIYGGSNRLAGSTAAELPAEYSWAAPLLGTWKATGYADCLAITWNAAGQYLELKFGRDRTVNSSGRLAYDAAGSLRVNALEYLEKTNGGTRAANLQINIFDGNQIDAIIGRSPTTFTRW